MKAKASAGSISLTVKVLDELRCFDFQALERAKPILA